MFKLSKLKLKGITINQRYTHTNTHGDVYLFYMYTLFINLHFESRFTFVRYHVWWLLHDGLYVAYK